MSSPCISISIAVLPYPSGVVSFDRIAGIRDGSVPFIFNALPSAAVSIDLSSGFTNSSSDLFTNTSGAPPSVAGGTIIARENPSFTSLRVAAFSTSGVASWRRSASAAANSSGVLRPSSLRRRSASYFDTAPRSGSSSGVSEEYAFLSSESIGMSSDFGRARTSAGTYSVCPSASG